MTPVVGRPCERTTGDAKVVYKTPPNGSHPYPWPVHFSWNLMPGSKSYQVEISLDPNFQFVSPKQISLDLASNIDHYDFYIDVDKETIYWRVRAHGPNVDGA